MDKQDIKKEELLKRIETVLISKGIDREMLGKKTAEELLEEISIYHQELEYQNQELMRIRDELEISNKHFQDLFDRAPVGYVLTNEDFSIIRVNSSFTETTGMANNLIKGKPLSYFVDPDSQDDFYLLCRRLTAAYGNGNSTLKMTRHNLEPAITKVNAKRMIPVGGNLYLFAFADISREQAAIAELTEARRQALEADMLKTAFLNNLSHEIRTPLNGILGFLDFLHDPDTSPEQLEQYARIISQSSSQLLDIINDLVQMASLDAGQERIHDKPVHITQIFSQLSDKFKLRALNKNIGLQFVQPGALFPETFVTDAEKLLQILSALIDNAIKFTNKGQITCKAELKGSIIQFLVKDTGIGIPKEHHKMIFEKFRQVFPTRDKAYGGNGLGLSIAKANCDLLGGSIRLESEMGNGSVFIVSLPYKVPEKTDALPPAGEETAFRSKIAHNKPTVAVAEDEWSNYMLLEQILKRYGLNVVHYTNGKDTVEGCRNNPGVRLVLMDLKMPVLNGYEATRLLKKDYPDLPIIAITAYALSGDRERAIDAGCDDYISKPVQKQKLIEILNHYLK